MTPSLFLIGLGAGAASALLHASIASGSPLALALVVVAPLPILIAGIGWSHVAGLVGAAVGALILALASGPFGGLSFVVTVGLPSWWLAYLALLARPGASEQETEWYPVGRLVSWCATIGAGLICLTIPLIATDLETYQATYREIFTKIFDTATTTGRAPKLPPEVDVKALVDTAVKIIPVMVAICWTLLLTLNVWLAARICQASGRLTRPWPDLAWMTLPRGAGVTLAVSIGGSFLPGIPSLIAELFAAAFTVAFTLLGLAVMHVVTRGVPARGLLLYALYMLVALTPLGVFLAGLGLTEQMFGIRRRFGPPPGSAPPAAPANRS